MGPETIEPESKPRDRRAFNAYRHGLTGHVLVIEPNDEQAYKQHCQGIHQSFAPSGAMETDLVQSIADDRWRLKRAAAMESNIFALGLNEPDQVASDHGEVDTALATARIWLEHSKELDRLTLYESRIQRKIEKNMALLRQLQKDRRDALQKLVEEAAILGDTYAFPRRSPAVPICFFKHPDRPPRQPPSPPLTPQKDRPEGRLALKMECAKRHNPQPPTPGLRPPSPKPFQPPIPIPKLDRAGPFRSLSTLFHKNGLVK